MRKVFTVLSVFFCLSATTDAQNHAFGFDFGQAFAYYHLPSTSNSQSSAGQYSIGNGRMTGLSYRYYPDSANWFLSTGFDWFQGNQVGFMSYNTDTFSKGGSSMTLNSLRLQGQLNYVFRFRPVNIEIRAGFVLPLLSRGKENRYYTDTFGTTYTGFQNRFYPSIGFKGGIAFSKKIARNISCILNAEINVLNQKIRSSEIVSYEDPYGNDLNVVFPTIASRESIYRKKPEEIRNNRDVLASRFDSGKPTDKITYSQPMSGIALRFGFLFHF